MSPLGFNPSFGASIYHKTNGLSIRHYANTEQWEDKDVEVVVDYTDDGRDGFSRGFPDGEIKVYDRSGKLLEKHYIDSWV